MTMAIKANLLKSMPSLGKGHSSLYLLVTTDRDFKHLETNMDKTRKRKQGIVCRVFNIQIRVVMRTDTFGKLIPTCNKICQCLLFFNTVRAVLSPVRNDAGYSQTCGLFVRWTWGDLHSLLLPDVVHRLELM